MAQPVLNDFRYIFPGRLGRAGRVSKPSNNSGRTSLSLSLARERRDRQKFLETATWGGGYLLCGGYTNCSIHSKILTSTQAVSEVSAVHVFGEMMYCDMFEVSVLSATHGNEMCLIDLFHCVPCVSFRAGMIHTCIHSYRSAHLPSW